MPEFVHKPVMLAEVLSVLMPSPGGCYTDGTVGGGGHAEAILGASSPTGWLYGCDRDGAALKAARQRLTPYEGRFELRQMNFSEMAAWVPEASCDGVLLDLGVSSPQLDVVERGFSFQHTAPLDMRMDRRQALTAADFVNTAGVDELADCFWRYGGERESRRLARVIVQEREQRPLRTTTELADLISRVCPRRGKKTHPATRVFQALRIAVNDEIGSLNTGLQSAARLLKSGGRLTVITFHSLEDRVVKDFGRARTRDYTFEGPVDVPELRQPRVPELRWVTRKALVPGERELAENPRSRSAQLRVLEKI